MKSLKYGLNTALARCAGCCLGLILVAGCAEQIQQASEFTTNLSQSWTEASRPSEFTETEPYHGPRVRVAVSRFEVKRGVPPDLSEGLAGMLRATLAESGRFTPIEPLKQVDLDALKGGRDVQFVKQSTTLAGSKFQIPPLLVFGEVTEFEEGSSGNKATFLSTSPIGKWFGNTVLDVKSSHIAINVRLVDAATTDIIASKVLTRKVSDVDNVSFPGGDLGFGLNGYAKSPMGQAIRLAVEDATHFLIAETPSSYFKPR